jgi:hypothetical protein
MRSQLPVYCARLRLPVLVAGGLALVAGVLLDLPALLLTGLVAFAAGLALYLRVGTVRADPVTVRPPVAGRWLAVNSPANKIPSHGLHAYGQTYAIDLVHEPEGGARPGFVWLRPLARPPRDFPGFGQPVFAPADALVVRVHDRERDHWSRTSAPALLYLVAEGAVRELLGPSRILGNHVVLDLGGGVYAALAHLRRRSTRVRAGQRVAAGEQLAECGNSGNTTEPHVHFQLMDHRGVAVAAGLPFRFDRFEVDRERRDGVPRNQEPFVAAIGTETAAPRPGGTRR